MPEYAGTRIELSQPVWVNGKRMIVVAVGARLDGPYSGEKMIDFVEDGVSHEGV